ncbi:MAG: hypothetical protein HZC55_18575 [Verrucomicrobia bacterium]|nr:hypothetical protein [Verrucomicrobiota bacterium]
MLAHATPAPSRACSLGVLLAAGAAVAAGAAAPVAALPESQLAAIRDGYTTRVAAILAAERGLPLERAEPRPPLSRGRAPFVRAYAFSLVGFAARALWLEENDAAANAALQELADHFLAHPEQIFDKDNFHWHSEAQLRLIEFYGAQGPRRRGALTPATELKCPEAIWLYRQRRDTDSRPHAHLAEADDTRSGTWWVEESENHHAQGFTTLWHFARLARRHPGFRTRRYDDGRTAEAHHADWNRYLKRYLLERARKGLFIEFMSVAYNAHLLKGFFNVHDFADDPELRRLTRHLLDLYFAHWAQEQLHGIAGGGRARLYSDIHVPASALGHLFFGLGLAPAYRCDLFTALTTSYRPELVVVDLACDLPGRGRYEVTQRPLGLAVSREHHAPPHYRLRTDDGGILRYSYCTPAFILGTAMGEARPADDWTMISSQNRRHGVIFASHPAAAILPQCELARDNRAYNTQWSVQRRGTLIGQKLRTSVDAGRMRVWFAADGLTPPAKIDGWVCTETDGAFAAVHVARGGFAWREDDRQPARGRWLYPEDEFSPVILEVAERSDFSHTADFHAALRQRRPAWDGAALRYRSLAGDDFTFFADYSRPPLVNGVPVDCAPPRAFDSPFLQSEWDSGRVTLQKGARRVVLDFHSSP